MTAETEADMLPHADQEGRGQKDSERCRRCAKLRALLHWREDASITHNLRLCGLVSSHPRAAPGYRQPRGPQINTEADGHTGQPQTHG